MSGHLIYVMGPSGSGKDTLLQGLLPLLSGYGCQIARRVITRPVQSTEANAASVSLMEFAELEASGRLAMAWRANGLAYGIPREIDDTLDAGNDVLVNGSRAYLPHARKRYANLVAILLTVDQDVLRQRLQMRGREDVAQIQARIVRNRQFQCALGQAGIVGDGQIFVVDNSGGIEQAIETVALYLVEGRICA